MPLLGTLLAGGVLYAGAQGYYLFHRQQKKPSLGEILAAQPQLPAVEEASIHEPAVVTGLLVVQPARLAAWLQEGLTALKPPALLRDARREQLAELTGEEPELNEQVQQKTHYLYVSLTALGVSAAGALLHSPLIFVSIPLLGYVYIDVIRGTYRAFKEKRHRLLRTFEAIIVGGELLAGFYFVSSLAATLYFVAERALIKAEERSRKSLINVFGQQPRSVWVLIDGTECEIAFEDVQAGDIVVVDAGGVIPVDGIVLQGSASVDQHMLTGEAQPVEKSSGDPVLASTIVLAGKIFINVERAGSETAAAQIGVILNQTAEFKQTIEAHGIALVERFIPLTLVMSTVSLPFVGVNHALALLESSFGYNLRVSGPMSLLNLLQIAAQRGILIKDGAALDRLHTVDTVVFDKTGTLTLEQPHVGAIHPYNGVDEATLLTWAAAAEHRQTHPIARAILQAARERELALPEIDEAQYRVGYGIQVNLNGRTIRVGSDRFMAMEQVALPEQLHELQAACHDQGYSLVLVAVDQQLVGALELHPTIRSEAYEIVQQLKQRNLNLYIISGDHERPTRQMAQSLGIDNYFAEVLPQDKSALVEQLQREGRTVCFVGDGINDAIALKQANLSVSLRGASTAATDTAQVVLMDSSLRHLVALLDLGREFKSNMRGNLLMATVPSVICIGGVYLLKWGLVVAIMLYNVSLVASLGNAFLPLLIHQFKGGEQKASEPPSITTSEDQPEQKSVTHP